MIRVLHLRMESTDEQARSLSAMLSRQAAAPLEITIRTIGRGGTYRSVLHAAVAPRRRLETFDVVHVWDRASLPAAQWAGAQVILASPSAGLPTLSKFRALQQIHCVCSTPVQLATTAAVLGKAACHLIDPRVEPAGNSLGRDAIRSRLGLTSDDRVLLAPGESNRHSGHPTAVWVVSMLHIIDPRYKLLIEGSGPYVAAARKMAMALKRPDLLRVAADRGINGSLAAAVDAALFTPTGECPVLPVAQVMADGLPVVSTDHPAFRGFLTEGNGALIGEWKKPPSVARRVLELFERPGLLQSQAAAAREEAASRFGQQEFLQRYMELYVRLAERARRAPQPDSLSGNPTTAFA